MSAKRQQALKIEPEAEIRFKGPYTRVVTEYFRLENPTDRPIAFKVKTTAPKRYCVRPNNGIIAPGKMVSVAVMLQPLVDGQNTTAAEKNKHKFMIQSVMANSETGNADDMFKSVSPEDIMDSKFRCLFDDTVPSLGTVPSTGSLNSNATSSTNTTGVKGVTYHADASDGESGTDALTEGVTRVIDHEVTGEGMFSSSHYSNIGAGSKDNLTNGADDDYTSGSLASRPPTYSVATGQQQQQQMSTAGGDVLPTASSTTIVDSLKRLQEENRDLRVKLAELERASRTTGGFPGAYNRFAAASGGSGAAAAAATSASSSSSQATKAPPSGNLLEQPLSGQVILTVLISLLIGFIIGKVDLGIL